MGYRQIPRTPDHEKIIELAERAISVFSNHGPVLRFPVQEAAPAVSYMPPPPDALCTKNETKVAEVHVDPVKLQSLIHEPFEPILVRRVIYPEDWDFYFDEKHRIYLKDTPND